ncbi:hypothetical protein HDU97_002025 [Phlyctochytrium planicorne]|nr:hypothetical protein HDU97_002025 [Phlyctochytrium planicorne]
MIVLASLIFICANLTLVLSQTTTTAFVTRTGVNPGQTLKPVPEGILPNKMLEVLDEKNFCLLLPAVPNISVGESEGNATSTCFGAAGGDGTTKSDSRYIISAHAVKTPKFVQVTGRINLIGLKVSSEGGGGQYDDASGGIEPFSHCLNYDRYVEIVGGDHFCVRCCNFPEGSNLKDVIDLDKNSPCFIGNDTDGCVKVIPGNYGEGFSYVEQAELPKESTGDEFVVPESKLGDLPVITTSSPPAETSTSSRSTTAGSVTKSDDGTVTATTTQTQTKTSAAGRLISDLVLSLAILLIGSVW